MTNLSKEDKEIFEQSLYEAEADGVVFTTPQLKLLKVAFANDVPLDAFVHAVKTGKTLSWDLLELMVDGIANKNAKRIQRREKREAEYENT